MPTIPLRRLVGLLIGSLGSTMQAHFEAEAECRFALHQTWTYVREDRPFGTASGGVPTAASECKKRPEQVFQGVLCQAAG